MPLCICCCRAVFLVLLLLHADEPAAATNKQQQQQQQQQLQQQQSFQANEYEGESTNKKKTKDEKPADKCSKHALNPSAVYTP